MKTICRILETKGVCVSGGEIGSHLHWKQDPDIYAIKKKQKKQEQFTFCMFKEIIAEAVIPCSSSKHPTLWSGYSLHKSSNSSLKVNSSCNTHSNTQLYMVIFPIKYHTWCTHFFF